MEGFRNLEKRVKESFENNNYTETLRLCEFINMIDPDHMMGNFYAGISHRKRVTDKRLMSQKDWEKVIFHLEKYLDGNDENNSRVIY